MQFVAHNHYNDNSLFIGDFEPAFLGLVISEADVSITNAGIAFFLLPKDLDVPEKLRFATILHEKLKEHFLHGLSAATCTESIGLVASEIASFYEMIEI